MKSKCHQPLRLPRPPNPPVQARAAPSCVAGRTMALKLSYGLHKLISLRDTRQEGI